MQPTSARRTVTGFAVALAVVTYVDRVCIAQAAPSIRRDLGLSAIEMGTLTGVVLRGFRAFALSHSGGTGLPYIAGTLAVPVAAHLRHRRLMRSAPDDAGRVEVEWQAMVERIGDLGVVAPRGSTPRQAARF